MKRTFFFRHFLVALLLVFSSRGEVVAQSKSDLPGSDLPEVDIPYPQIGQVRPRHARDVQASPWSVGGETLDRDFANYAAYKEYLGPLGVKMIRLQTGWAKTEQSPGIYDFAWLDTIVNDVVRQEVKPWLQLSYGNPLYPGGGGVGLGDGIPTSEEALAAWDRWVETSVARYRDRTDVWEIWNEPDTGNGPEPEDYADLYIRTAEIIRNQQPEAHLYALALAHIGDTLYLDAFLSRLQDRGKLPLLDEITHHGYDLRPEDSYAPLARLKAVAARYSGRVTFRQGEQGAPSTRIPGFALRNYDWTEISQAKWILRRMLGDIGHDVPSLVFTMADLRYISGEDRQDTVLNTKGLLATDRDLNVLYAKPSYYAVQHLASVIDQPVEGIRTFTLEGPDPATTTAYAFRRADGVPVVALWQSAHVPSNDLTPLRVEVTLRGVSFDEPVCVDLLSGRVYRIPEEDTSIAGDRVSISNFPLIDVPLLITEKTALETMIK